MADQMDRDTILADFQACTGIDHIDECIVILEQHDWNLMPAVRSAMTEPGHHPPTTAALDENSSNQLSGTVSSIVQPTESASPLLPDLQVLGADIFTQNPTQPSTSASSGRSPRMLNFKIEYRDRDLKLTLKDTDTIDCLKNLIEEELMIPTHKQTLSGWLNAKDRVFHDQTVLKDLELPKDNNLYLLCPDFTPESQPRNGENTIHMERLEQMYTLKIRFLDEDRMYNLNFLGSKTIKEVKTDVSSVIDVPVRNQVWSGWPNQEDNMTLAYCGVSYPVHELEVRRSVLDSHASSPLRTQLSNLSDELIEISDDEYEDSHPSMDVDEEMFATGSSVSRSHPLMPDNASDQNTALEQFVREFSSRYGECHPVFFIGSLENAIKEALLAKARERKLLAIYLHHDGSILSNVFCSQILCKESIVSYLSTNFITWAWDLTSEANKARLLTMCSQHFGSVAASTVRNLKVDQLPLLLLISRNRSVNEVVNVVHANVTLDELMTQLIQAVDVFMEQSQAEIFEEDQREQRESVKREQDAAYEESLAADRAKEEAKRVEKENQMKIEMEQEKKRHEEELQRRMDNEEKEAIRQSIEDQLPDEPCADCSEPVTVIRFRVPGGELLTRRFLVQNSLQVLLNYVISKGFHTDSHKVLTTYPRRDLTSVDASKTLQDLKLYPQETVIIEEK